MWKKIIVAVLVVTVVAAAVMAAIEVQGNAAATATQEAMATQTATPTNAGNAGQGKQQGKNAGNGAAAQQKRNQSLNNVGEPWSAAATIVELGEVGMTVRLTDGSEMYVELGPSSYWQAQGALAVGDAITIEGFYNGDQYHAATITQADGTALALRTATGQPLWSGGGADSGGAGNGGQGAGGSGQVQVAPEDWVTLTGVVVAVNRNGLTIETAAGEVLALTFGRADFWQGQAVQFTEGDAVEVKGFWLDGQFQSGQVTKTSTGERLLLRDPNGRPLWSGPGRNGGQGGNGGRGQGHATSTNG